MLYLIDLFVGFTCISLSCVLISISSYLHSLMLKDKVYRAVVAVNEAEGYKYHLVGGAAGTVSPSE